MIYILQTCKPPKEKKKKGGKGKKGKKDKKDKKSKKSKKSNKSEPEPEIKPKLPERPKKTEIVLKKVTLANFHCNLHPMNWSEDYQDFYWADVPECQTDAQTLFGSARVNILLLKEFRR